MAQDLADVVARVVAFEWERPVVDGINGSCLSIGQSRISAMLSPFQSICILYATIIPLWDDTTATSVINTRSTASRLLIFVGT